MKENMDIEKQKLQARVAQLSSETLRLTHTVTELTAKLNRVMALPEAAPQQVDAVQAAPGTLADFLQDAQGAEDNVNAMANVVEAIHRAGTHDDALLVVARYRRAVRAALASPSPAVPPMPCKTKVVPLEPTEAMLRAAISYREVDADDEILDPQLNMLDRQYRAMIAAAAQPTDTTAGE